MKKLHIVLSIVLTATVLFSGCSSSKPVANGPTWVKLGERLVDFRGDHDVIPVTANRGTFSALKFKVLQGPIFLRNVRVVYGNGTDTNIRVDRRIPAGTESRVFNLPGDKRIIKKINLNYKTAQRPGPQPKSKVIVFGRR